MELSDKELLAAIQRLPEANTARAEIRAKVYTVLLQRNGKIKAKLPQPNRANIKSDGNFGLAVDIIRDFLNVKGLVNTVNVFKQEAELHVNLASRKVLEDKAMVQTKPRQSVLEAVLLKNRDTAKSSSPPIVTKPFNPPQSSVSTRPGNPKPVIEEKKVEIPPISLPEVKKTPSQLPGLRLPTETMKPNSKVDLSIPAAKANSKNPLMQLRAQKEARAPTPNSEEDIEEDIEEEPIEIIKENSDPVTDSVGSSMGADASADSMALEVYDHVERIGSTRGFKG